MKRISIIFTFFISCTSFQKGKPFQLTKDQEEKVSEAIHQVREGAFEQAALIYDDLAKNLRRTSLEAMMLFNSGSSYREAKDCTSALNRYRKLLDQSLVQPIFKARGLLEISSTYECLGKDEMSFLSLKDLSHLRNHLSSDFQKTIYPARLSIAFAKLKNEIKAKHYKSLALTGILQLKMDYTSESKLTKDLSRIFYLMGRSYVLKKNLNAESFLSSFSYHQSYLLQGLLLKDNHWFPKIKKELLLLYEKLEISLKDPNFKKLYAKSIKFSLNEAEALIKKEKDLKVLSFYKNYFLKMKVRFNM